MMEDIPTVSFCELVKKADSYFGKRVRLTATFMQATEGQYLIDETCDQMGIGPYANTKEKLGINYAGIDKASIDAINKSLKQIQSFADGHAIVEVIGTLRNESRHDFVWYDRRFDVEQIVSVSREIIPFAGKLEPGNKYRAMATCNKEEGLTLAIRLQVLFHQAARIEWDNRESFHELTDGLIPGSKRQVVFRVISKDIVNVSTPNRNRWNVTYHCEIVRFE